MDMNKLHFDLGSDVYKHKLVSRRYSAIDNVVLLDIEENKLVLDIDIILDPRSRTNVQCNQIIHVDFRILVHCLDKHFHSIYIYRYIQYDFLFEMVLERQLVEVNHRHVQI